MPYKHQVFQIPLFKLKFCSVAFRHSDGMFFKKKVNKETYLLKSVISATGNIETVPSELVTLIERYVYIVSTLLV